MSNHNVAKLDEYLDAQLNTGTEQSSLKFPMCDLPEFATLEDIANA